MIVLAEFDIRYNVSKERVCCGNCKYWHQDGRDSENEGECPVLSFAPDDISFYIPGGHTVETVMTNKNFGCSYFESKE